MGDNVDAQGYLNFLLNALPWVAKFTLISLLIGVTIVAVLRVIDYIRFLRQKSIILEITPPAFQDKTVLATEQLFSVLSGLGNSRSLLDKLLMHKVVISLEITSTQKNGIRYLIRLPKTESGVIESTISSYLPDARVRAVKDYLPSKINRRKFKVLSFRQTGHFAYPLEGHESLRQHDPVAYLTGTMTKLASSDQIAMQVVVSPAVISEAHRVDKKIRRGQDASSSLASWFQRINFGYLILYILLLPVRLMTVVASALMFNDIPSSSKQSVYVRSRISPTEQSMVDSMHDKLIQSMFRVEIRALLIVDDKNSRQDRVKGIKNSLAAYSSPKHQSLKARLYVPNRIIKKYHFWKYKHRLPSFFHRSCSVLSSSELASIYHFPNSESAKTENVVKSMSRNLPAPLSLKSKPELNIMLGVNNYHGVKTPIGLTTAERERHIYVIGGTGNGKTTMLQYAIEQDIRNGKGVAVIDPHGDLAQSILRYIPEERIKDVIYFDPDDIDYPICVNLLEIPTGLSGSALEREKDRITESVISVFRKIFSDDDSGGHRIEYILRNTIQTALTIEDSTIFTVFELLTNDKYRMKVTNGLPAGTLKNFWINEVGKAGAMQRIKMSHGVTSKIGRFEFSPATKRVMGQAKSTINFDDILSSGKILICNFSKGALGEDTSALFGTAVLAKLQVASLRRARLSQVDRTPYYLYVDEFQTFATMPFVQMLSEARKYKLFLTMAEQSTAQLEEQRLVNIILANVGTVVCFRTGSPIDEQLVLPLFKPFINEGEIANLPSYNYYMRIAAVQSQEPLSGETVLMEDEGSAEVARKVTDSSRSLFARKYIDPREVKTSDAKKKKLETKTIISEPGFDISNGEVDALNI